MADNRDELGEALKKIAAGAQRRGHATWFHATNEFKAAVEVHAVAQWAKVINERYDWDIREIRKNSDAFPDCLADFGLRETNRSDVMGIEVTELVERDAINAHQEARCATQPNKSGKISDAKRLDLLERMVPVWSQDKFRERLEERVHEKDKRSRDHTLKKQFLLIVTDEPDLNENTLAQYTGEISLPHPKNFDAVYVMASYVPNMDGEGRYPVFEAPISGT